MSKTVTDEQNISRYRRGFDWFLNVVRNNMRGRPWRRLGIFQYADTPYIDNSLLYLSPKQVLLAMASEVKREDTSIVMILDALHAGEMGLHTRMYFEQFVELFDSIFPGATKFYFGPKASERTWLHGYPSLKIPLQWLISRPNRFAEVLSDASPVGENVSPADASFENLAGMAEVLVEKLGPPSVTEEVLSKIKHVDPSQYAGDAVDIVTFFVSPGSAVTKGVKYLGKLVGIMRDRRKQGIKEVYSKWNEYVRTSYTEENLREFFDESSNESELIQAVNSHSPVLIVSETRDTAFDLFLPLVLQYLVEQVGYLPPELRPRSEEEVDSSSSSPKSSEDEHDESDISGPASDEHMTDDTASTSVYEAAESTESTAKFDGLPQIVMFLDEATHLSKFSRSFNFAIDLPERYPNISVAASFFTETDQTRPHLREGVIKYLSERALVFDLHPHLFDEVTGNIPVSVKAWLIGELQKMEQIHTSGRIAFLEYYSKDIKKWTLRVVDRPEALPVRTIRGLLRRWTSH